MAFGGMSSDRVELIVCIKAGCFVPSIRCLVE